jgi:glutathione S-transferase
MKIYQVAVSPFAVRVRIAIYAKGLTPEFADPPGGMGSAAYRKLTPFGKVPTLVCDDGTVIAESAVINEYLDEQFPEPGLLPTAPRERARARMLVQMTDAYIFARFLPLFATVKTDGKGSPAIVDGMDGVKEGLAALERFLDEATYAVGDGLTLADCALVPALFYITEYAEEYFGVGDALDPCPKLASYWARIQADPHVARALAEGR